MYPRSGNNPFLAIGGVADAAVLRHGAAFLERGGPAGRAAAEYARGASVGDAARTAARQGKGHVAELRLSAEHSLACGVVSAPFRTRPNPVANDPMIDVEVLDGRTRVSGAQVGVGSPSYAARKARSSQAPQIVVNHEAHAALRESDPAAARRARTALAHDGISSGTLSGARAEEDAQTILECLLRKETTISELTKVGIAGVQGVQSFASAVGTGLLYEAVERLYRGQPFDASMVDRAVRGGVDAGVRTALQTYVMVDHFLAQAADAFRAKLLRGIGSRAAVAGAIADVVVSTARDVVAWLRSQITFEEVLRRAGVHVFAAAGALVGVALVAPLCRGLPPWAAMLASVLGGWAGGSLGADLGRQVFAPALALGR